MWDIDQKVVWHEAHKDWNSWPVSEFRFLDFWLSVSLISGWMGEQLLWVKVIVIVFQTH